MRRAFLKNVTAAFLAGSVAGGGFGVWQGQTAWTASVEALKRDALLATDKLELLMRNIRLGAEAVAARLDTDDLAGSAARAWPAIEVDNLGLRTVLVLDEQGTAVANMRDEVPTIGMNFADRAYFQAIAGGAVRDYYIGEPVITRPSGAWALPTSVPILRENGTVAGVVVGAVLESYFDTSAWQTVHAEAQVFMYLHGVDAVIDIRNPRAPSEAAAAVSAHFQAGPSPSDAAAPHPVDLPDMMAYATDSASARFHVVVARDRARMLAAARDAGVLAGLGMAALVGSLLMIGLQARVVARQRSADARRIAADAHRIREDAAQLRLLEERLRLAADAAKIGVWETDLLTGKSTWDPVMHSLHGLEHGAVNDGRACWADLIHPADRASYEASMTAAITGGIEYKDVYRIVTPDGEERIIKARATVLRDANGTPTRVIGVNFDVTEQVRRERDLIEAHAQIQHEALHDPLTELGNRRALSSQLEQLTKHYPADAQIAFLHIDLDRFKAVNDLFGHAAGDHLLVQVAEILRRTTRSEDALYRLGGDEFAVVLTEGDVDERASQVADRIVAACRKPVIYEDKELLFGASVGICIGTIEGAHDLVGNADIALYQAKHVGRNRSAIFTPELRRQAEDRKRLADALTDALAADQITLRLQPQVWADSRTLAGAEALVRWRHAELGELPPSYFLPVAQELGILHNIDDIILMKTVAAVRRLSAQGLILPRVSVNTSHRRIMQPDLLDRIDALSPLPCTLAFELMETIDFDGVSDDLMTRLAQIRARGIEIEVDDFGTGRASITTLLRVQPDRVKIDRQLVTAEILSGRKAQSVLRAITEMAEALAIPVTAEGVETEAHARRATDLGCDVLQGFLFAEPLTEAGLLDWAAASHAPSCERTRERS